MEVDDMATTINFYCRYYLETNWASQHVQLARIMCEFAVGADEGTTKMGPQLYEDIRRTWNKMPHAYLTMVKDERRLVLLHRATHHATSLGAHAESWNDKVLMFTRDVVGSQMPQAVFLPHLLLITINQEVAVHPLKQQLLDFHANNNLEVQEHVGAAVPAELIDKIVTPTLCTCQRIWYHCSWNDVAPHMTRSRQSIPP
jgi:hypothetical protein